MASNTSSGLEGWWIGRGAILSNCQPVRDSRLNVCLCRGVGGVRSTASNTSSGLEGWWIGRGTILSNCQPVRDSRLSVCLCTGVGGVCSTASNTSSGLEGWWIGRGALLSSVSECLVSDEPAGLHFITYRAPANFSTPDQVNVKVYRCV